jgi:hypothetical protein
LQSDLRLKRHSKECKPGQSANTEHSLPRCCLIVTGAVLDFHKPRFVRSRKQKKAIIRTGRSSSLADAGSGVLITTRLPTVIGTDEEVPEPALAWAEDPIPPARKGVPPVPNEPAPHPGMGKYAPLAPKGTAL